MEFGTLILPKPQRAIEDTRYAEERGFTQAWFPDSHMIYGDVYACMALAAANTRRIRLGTGISVASNRIAPVTAHSIATINELAPGRVTLGFGTGHTGRRVMGLPPVKFEEFREQARVIHDLLKPGEATYQAEGLSRKIRFLHRDRRFINLDDAIPLYVAANAPKALRLAGEYGDGLITGRITDPERMDAIFKTVRDGASAVGRTLIGGRIPCVTQQRRGRDPSLGCRTPQEIEHDTAEFVGPLEIHRVAGAGNLDETRVRNPPRHQFHCRCWSEGILFSDQQQRGNPLADDLIDRMTHRHQFGQQVGRYIHVEAADLLIEKAFGWLALGEIGRVRALENDGEAILAGVAQRLHRVRDLSVVDSGSRVAKRQRTDPVGVLAGEAKRSPSAHRL